MHSLLSIGGNALDERLKNLQNALPAIYKLYGKGSVIITHGNGPQVGELASVEDKPLALLTAQTEAEIGIMLKNEIINYFSSKHKSARVEVVLTTVLVNKKDNAFKNPTKPIGIYYSKAEKAKLKKMHWSFGLFSKGYKRVVASPKPLRILNISTIKLLAEAHCIIIAAGGGGIPIMLERNNYKFAEAVIDKDLASQVLANDIGIEQMFILTNVDGAYRNFNSEKRNMIGNVTLPQMEKYLSDGNFEQGTMLPKVNACINFVKNGGKAAVIVNLSKAQQAINFQNCTVIRK
jgi:carbamate kinase